MYIQCLFPVTNSIQVYKRVDPNESAVGFRTLFGFFQY